MPDDITADEARESPASAETMWLGEKPGAAPPIHEEATILGGLDVSRPDERTEERPTGAADLAEFRRALVDIGLFDEAELDSLAANVPESQGVLGLARFLQQAGRLTAYQAAAVYQRKSRGLLIGNYTILEKLGAGGMGMVFKARHRKLGRVVALKILPPSFARDRTAVARFKREIEAAGRLKHPNIVAALDADEDRGVHFLVMEYVEGSDLDNVVRRRGPLPLSQAVDYVIQAALGLEAAHAQGIVHRDIKPSNLMLDGAGTVRLLDLGLARIAEESNPFGQAAATRLTASGMYMGTVDYMAPEQAEDARKADHRADIYSLGCTLYYLLTGREPFAGDTVLKRLLAHMERPAPLLRTARPEAPAPLEDVYQRMMAKRPAGRPATMTDLIVLLEMCRTAIAEAPPTPVAAPKSSARLMVFDEGKRKTSEKGPAPARAGRDESVVVRQHDADDLPVGPELSLEDLVADVRPDVPMLPPAPTTIKRGVKPTEPVLTRSAPPRGQRPDRARSLNLALQAAAVAMVCGFLAFLLWPRRTPRPKPTPPAADMSVATPAAPSPVATSVAIPEAPAPPPVANASLAVVEPLVEVGRFTGHDSPHVDHVHVLRDGKTLLTTCSDGKARLWDMASGRELRRFCHPAGLRPAAIHPDGRHVLTGCNDGLVRLWDLQTGESRPIVKHEGRVWAVAVSPDGTSALSAGDHGIVRVSDLRKGGETRRFETHNAWDWSVAFSPDGRRALTGSGDGVVWLEDLTRNDPPVALRGQPEFAFSVAFAPDGRHAASSAFGQITYWDLQNRRGVKVPIEPEHLPSLVISPNGRRIWFATGVKGSNGASLDQGMIGFWDTDGHGPPTILNRGHGHLGMDVLPDGGIATADLDGVARIWRPSRSLDRARKLDADGQDQAALAEYSELIADRPDDARLLIERGRLLYELGRLSEARADYTRAAERAPDNPQVFLDAAGWWVAGPYPPDLKVPVGFQIDGEIDPSKPAPPTGNEQRQWRRAQIEMQGKLDFGKIFNAEDAAAYALVIFHSPIERDVVLLWGVDDEMAFYLNGQHILEDIVGYSPFGTRLSLVRVKAGRNTILAKVVNGKGPHSLNLMISLAPADLLRAHVRLVKRWRDAVDDYQRALARDPSSLDVDLYHDGGTALGETGRWSEAAAAWRRVVELDPANAHHQERLVAAHLGAGDLAAVGRITETLIERERQDRPNPRLGRQVDLYLHNRLCWTIALNPGGMIGSSPLVLWSARRPGAREQDPAVLLTSGAVDYRAGQFERAVTQLNNAIKARNGKDTAFDWVFLAMARHRLKQPEARQALARAKELAKDGSMEWYQRAEIEYLLQEAELELARPVK
jgi:eukaryotic-like serine/threonine-protein kinase